jgi:Rft protein
MTYQSILKHILTEGDKLILSWLSPLEDQGGYAVAVNYGQLPFPAHGTCPSIPTFMRQVLSSHASYSSPLKNPYGCCSQSYLPLVRRLRLKNAKITRQPFIRRPIPSSAYCPFNVPLALYFWRMVPPTSPSHSISSFLRSTSQPVRQKSSPRGYGIFPSWPSMVD